MDPLLNQLPDKERRGSRPRCLMLTHGNPAQVAARLVEMMKCDDIVIDHRRHRWAPRGFINPNEIRLEKVPDFLPHGYAERLSDWWLAIRRGANTPNWDIVSQATIGGHEGLILFEAKSHEAELSAAGKPPGNPANHKQISHAIREASDALKQLGPGWNLSQDTHYQLANRFAWGWKIAAMGMPVILVYLGFLNAREMVGRNLISDNPTWEKMVKEYAGESVPDAAWGASLRVVNGAMFRPLIRTMRVDLDGSGG